MKLPPFVCVLLTATGTPLLPTTPARAGTAGSGAPQLRIETGTHTAAIGQVTSDRSGRLVLTTSADKTARLWEFPSRRLLRTLRPPVVEAEISELARGSLSADGRLAAVSTTINEENATNASPGIFLFDSATGRMARQIDKLPGTISDLALSPDGKYLAAAFEDRGLRVYDASTGLEVGRDAKFDSHASACCVDWSPDGRLAAAGGTLRLYDARSFPAASSRPLVPAAEISTANGADFSYVRFTADGGTIAAGPGRAKTVAVYDGRDLAFRFTPDASGVRRLARYEGLAWSADGSSLTAVGDGREETEPRRLVRRWGRGGKGKAEDHPVEEGVSDVRGVSPAGGFFVNDGPVWGTLSPDGAVDLPDESAVVGAGNLRADLTLSTDGSAVGFSFGQESGQNAEFSIAARTLRFPVKRSASAGTRLSPAHWTDFTNFPGVFVFDGAKTADGRLIVETSADGTIRWRRADNARYLLAFFPHPDGRRWVVWTPEGYYDCSPGGEELIAWHVNRGRGRAADVFPAGRFRAVYYRPDVVGRVLQTRSAGEALKQANRALGRPETGSAETGEAVGRLSPPVVELETGGVFGTARLPAGADGLKIRYRVRQTGAEPPTKVTVRFNGRLVDAAAPLPEGGESAEMIVPLPAGMAGELGVFAEHRLAVSQPAVLRIERQPDDAAARRPRLFLIAAGVSSFQANHPEGGQNNGGTGGEGKPPPGARTAASAQDRLVLPDLLHAADDARHIAETFREQQGHLYEAAAIKTLTDQEATAAAMREALREVARQARPEDVAVVFFAGHGVVDPRAGYYLATYEADPNAPAATTLTGAELSTLLEGIKARTVLALDTCHSAGALGGSQLGRIVTGPGDLTGFVNALSSAEQGTVVISSSAATEESLEDPVRGGLFTVAFREGLTRRDASHAGDAVTCLDLRDWLAKRLPELVSALVKDAPDSLRQTPVCIVPKGVPDFTLAEP